VPSGRSEEAWGLGAVRRLEEKGEEVGLEGFNWLGCASITGGGVRLSAARACGAAERVAEENIRAARAACEDAEFSFSELGL